MTDKANDTSYLNYLNNLEKIKELDKSVCTNLIKFFDEANSKNYSFEVLRKLSNRVSQEINDLKRLYKDIAKEHKQIEVYELYSTFIRDVIGNEDKSNIIFKKMNGLKATYDNIGNDEKAVSSYQCNNGIMLISLKKINFDEIVYVNEVGASLLGHSIEDILGTHLTDYVPKPYNIGHTLIMKNFLDTCHNTEIISPANLFLENKDGFLVELKIAARLTTFKHEPFIIVSLRRRPTTRQVGIVSEYGQIYSYSQNFPDFIGAKSNFIRNESIQNYFPQLCVSKMKLYQPYVVSTKDHTLAFVHTIRTFRTVDIHVLLLIHNQYEIEL